MEKIDVWSRVRIQSVAWRNVLNGVGAELKHRRNSEMTTWISPRWYLALFQRANEDTHDVPKNGGWH